MTNALIKFARPIGIAAILCLGLAPPLRGADQNRNANPNSNTNANANANANNNAESGGNAQLAAARAGNEAKAQPQIEQQRNEAQRQAEQSLDKDAISVIQETQNAVKAIGDNKKDEATAAMERASGKITILLGKNPVTAMLPVHAVVEVIDTAPRDPQQIKQLAKAVDRAVDDRDFPSARVLLQGMISEIRVRTHHLPLGTYPEAMKQATALLQQNKTQEAAGILTAALNTLVVIDRVTPLPLAVAQSAIEDAQANRDKDKNLASTDLALAQLELQRAKELGCAGKDPEYAALNDQISALEKQVKGGENSESAFGKLKEKLASFFKRQSQSEKRSSEVAQR